MEIQAIKTHRVEVGDSLLELLDQYISSISKDTVVAIAAKVISLCEGRVVDKKAMSKKELIWQEAEMVAQGYENSHGTIFTIKKGILLPSAGIDESNANDSYILYPINIQRTATKI